jgi:hypothetical protein
VAVGSAFARGPTNPHPDAHGTDHPSGSVRLVQIRPRNCSGLLKLYKFVNTINGEWIQSVVPKQPNRPSSEWEMDLAGRLKIRPPADLAIYIWVTTHVIRKGNACENEILMWIFFKY